MNLKCGYFTVGGIMCGSLVGIFVGALAVNASLGYMILLLGAWGLCLYITSRSLMDDARREEAVLNQPAEEFDDPDELPPLYWEGYDRGYTNAENHLQIICIRSVVQAVADAVLAVCKERKLTDAKLYTSHWA